MKKLFMLIFFVAIVLFFPTKDTKATLFSEGDCVENMINPDNLVPSSTGYVKYNGTISLEYGYYTLIVSPRFLGLTSSNYDSYDGTWIGDPVNSNDRFDGFQLTYCKLGFYCCEYLSEEEIDITFNSFGNRKSEMNSLYKNECYLFQGSSEVFQGFKDNPDVEDYDEFVSEKTIYTNVDKPISIATIKNNILVYDNYDEDITFSISETNYDPTQKLSLTQSYFVKFKAIDSSSNTTEVKLNIIVSDITAPTISGPNSVSYSITDEVTKNKILSNYSASDSYEGDVTSLMYIKDEDFNKIDFTELGDHVIVLYSKDSSGNEISKEITIQSTDSIKPELVVKDYEVLISQIGSTMMYAKTIENCLVSATDNSGHCDVTFLCPDVLNNPGRVGQYTVYITATDAAGNKAEKTALLKIVDDLAPNFYIKSIILTATKDAPLSQDVIKKEIARSLDERSILYSNINIISSDYEETSEIGTYSIHYSYDYKDIYNYEVLTIEVVAPTKTNTNYWLYLLAMVPIGLCAPCISISKKKRNDKILSQQ